MPAGISDRAAYVWEPLPAIADQAAGRWPERARQAAVALNNARAQRDPSLGVQLLADCQRIFTTKGIDRLTSEDLIEALTELDESPWADLRGKPLDARGLARRLRKYDVTPANHRFEIEIRRGYLLEDFHDPWQRYLTPVAYVADVALIQRERRADEPVALSDDEEGYDLSSIYRNGSLSTAVRPLQPLSGTDTA